MNGIAYAVGQQGGSSAGNSPAAAPFLVNFIPIILIFGVFYFLLIRPQQQKQKEHARMVFELKKNDEVITAGGLHGVVSNIKDKSVVVKVDENVKVEVEKSHISHVMKK